MIAVPATAVLATLADAADAGIPAAVVISSGFEELGEEGAAMQRAMLDLARRRSIRIVGPNCLGLMSNLPDISLDATFSGSVPPPGGLAFASQSGGVGIVLIDVARSTGARRRVVRLARATRPTSPATTCSPPGATTRG